MGMGLISIFFLTTFAIADQSYSGVSNPSYRVSDSRQYRGTTAEDSDYTKTYYDSPEPRAYIPWTFPGINVTSPAGYGAQWGNIFVGGGLQNRTRGTQSADGSLGAGFGLGNAQKYVALETSISILSLTGANSFQRGGINLKLSRQFPKGFGIAAGSELIANWGGIDGSTSYYGAVSKMFVLRDDPTRWFSALTLSVGAGNGRFIPTTGGSIGVFGSAAVRLKEPVAFIADWSGQDLNLGLSLAPFRKIALYVNPAVVDLTGSAGDGARFILGVGYAYTFA